jgi:Xaa-Pro aminopeptidase
VQRWVYSLVHEAQEAALRELRPGVAFDVPYDAALRVLIRGLAELRLVPGDEVLARDDQRHRRWTAHRISHMLGLDVHDCAAARDHTYFDGVYREGMVLTVEPGLYFAADDALVPEQLRGTGIRLEDDVVITADGYRMLSSALPRSAEEVEAWMAQLA